MAKTPDESKKTNGKPYNKADILNKAAKSSKVNRPNKANIPNTVKKAKNKNDLSSHKFTTILYKVILVALLVIIFYPPYLRGLFFENDYIKAELFVFIIFALFWVFKLLKKEKLIFETPLDYASFGFVLVYLVSIIAAVSVDLAKGEWLKYCMYFAVFFMLTDIASAFKNRIRVLWAITFSAAGVCILGIDAMAGGKIVTLGNNVFNKLYLISGMEIPEKGTFFSLFVGGRINSTLQYPNTLAAYLMAAFFVVLALMLLSDSRVKRIIASCVGFIFFVTFIFTLSRGAYIVFPFMVILFIIVLPKGMRTKGVVYLIVPFISSLPAIIKISGLLKSNPEGNPSIWLWVLSGIVLCLILSFVSEYIISFFERINWKVYIYIIGSLFIIACAGLLVAFNVRQPLTVAFPADSKASSAGIMRSVVLKPDREYRMSFDVEGKHAESSESQYSVIIRSKSENDILFDRYDVIAMVKEAIEPGSMKKEIEFKVPADSKIVNVYFNNHAKGTDLTFDNCIIIDARTGKQAVKVPLKYKYIPELITSRFQDIQANKSSYARTVFYKDGLRIFGDHWLIGAGGGAWSLLYFSYQSYLYFTTQAHNYYLQLAVETGTIGLLVLMLLLLSIIFIFIKQRYKEKADNTNLMVLQAALFIILITLFLHAGIDFDFSFPAMLLLVWEVLALFNAGIKETAAQTGGAYLFNLKELKLNSAFGVLLSLVLVIMSSTIIAAISHFDKGSAVLKQNELDLSIWHFQRAAELNPSRAEYKINYSSLVLQKGKSASAEEKARANKWISEAETQSRYDVSLLPFIVKYYFSTGKIKEGLDISERMIGLRPFRVEEWEQLTGAYNSVLQYYLNNKNAEQSLEMVNRGLDAIPWALKVNKGNRNPFIFNAQTSQTLERFAYYKDNGSKENISNLNNITFYSLPAMDIDNDGTPDQWNSTSSDSYKLENGDNMLKIDKLTSDKNTYIQSRSLLLKADSKYRIDLELYNEGEPGEIQYLLTGVSKKKDTLKLLNGVYSATVTTPGEIKTANLKIFIDKDCMIKSLRITEIK